MTLIDQWKARLPKLGKVQREILRDLLDGDARSLGELSAGHPYISAQTALKTLEREGLIETWFVPNDKRGGAFRKLARLSSDALKVMHRHDR